MLIVYNENMRSRCNITEVEKTLLATLITFGLLVLQAALSSCGTSSPSASTTSANISSTSARAATTSTYGSMSNAGQNIYVRHCSFCHGDKGQGGSASALIGTNIGLNKHSNAEGLLNNIKSTMPINSPGSLSHEEYLQVTAYLLLQNNLATSNTSFSESQLSTVLIK
jgi:mono/diheme cytochrome c family protein